MIAALLNWNNDTITGTLYLPDVGLQSAGAAKDVWNNETVTNVETSYTASIAAHGVLLLELSDTISVGTYPAERCGRSHSGGVTFTNVYGLTDSAAYTLTIHTEGAHSEEEVTVTSSASGKATKAKIMDGAATVLLTLSAAATTLSISIRALG